MNRRQFAAVSLAGAAAALKTVLVLRTKGLIGAESLMKLADTNDWHTRWRLEGNPADYGYLEVRGLLDVAGGDVLAARKLEDLVPMGGTFIDGWWKDHSAAYLKPRSGTLSSSRGSAHPNKFNHHKVEWFMAGKDGKRFGGKFHLTNVVRLENKRATSLLANGITFTGKVRGYLVNLPTDSGAGRNVNRAEHCSHYFDLRSDLNHDRYWPWRAEKLPSRPVTADAGRESDPVFCPPALF